MNVFSRLAPLLGFALSEFGPLIVFMAIGFAFGAKAAIAGSVAFIAVDAVRRLRWRIPVTRLYVFSSVLTVMFGAIDLVAVTPFMLKYEAVITNVATGLAFVIGARGAKPMLQELAEKQKNATFRKAPTSGASSRSSHCYGRSISSSKRRSIIISAWSCL